MKNKIVFAVGMTFSLASLFLIIYDFIYHKINSYIVIYDFVAIMLVAFAVSLFFVLVKKMPSFLKCTVPVVLFLFTLAFLLFLRMGGVVEFRAFEGESEIEAYNESLEGKTELELYFSPVIEIDKYGDFSDISYYKYHLQSIFSDKAHTVIAKYSKENFEETVKHIENDYTFVDEPVIEGDMLPVFTFEGFDFRMITHEHISTSYPRSVYLIGINRNTSEIAYVSFENMDLDSISNFENFISSYCGWHHIIKERKR